MSTSDERERGHADAPRAPLPPPPRDLAPEEAGVDFEDAGYVPPDPDEPPPFDLGRAVGDVLPWGSVAVLLVWGALFLWFAMRGEMGDSAAYLAWGASGGGFSAPGTAWRSLASTFLHAGAAHVGLNAVSMLMFGPAAEAMFSRWAFWSLYAFGGAGASLGSLAWHRWRHGEAASLSVGGSGAIFALGGALIAAAFRLRGRLAVGRARALAAGALLLLTQSLAAGFSHLGTDNAAHASGLVAGCALGMLVPLSPRLGARRAGWVARAVGVAAVTALAAALAIAVRSGLAAGR
jgi:rhomboid protease GluP